MTSHAGRRPLTYDIDIHTLYSMRNEGMTNRQIAEKLDCSYQTVLNHIGPMPKEMQEKAIVEKQKRHRAPKVEKEETQKTELEPVAKLKQPKSEVEPDNSVIERLTAHDSYVLQFECTKVTANGKLCKYTIDTKAKTVTAHDGILAGTMSREELATVIFELKECMNKLTSC